MQFPQCPSHIQNRPRIDCHQELRQADRYRTYTSTIADLEDAPWMAFTPIVFLFLTVVALNSAGDKLRDYLDVRELAL